MTQNYDAYIRDALQCMQAAAHFEKTTQFGASKANELLAAAIVNRWLAKKAFGWRIELSSRPRGVDGTLVGSGMHAQDVEFKSSKQTSSEFQFAPDFPFSTHGCVVMTEFIDGHPRRMFIAHGPKTMEELKERLEADADRISYNRERGDRLRLFASSRNADTRRQSPIKGLADVRVDFGTTDRVDVLERAEIDALLDPRWSMAA
jgi:hypothetical protein